MIMKNKQTVLLYILAIVLVVGGLLALWLPNRNAGENADATRPDTDPDAPFVDLSDAEKERVLKAVETRLSYIGYDAVWYGDAEAGENPLLYYGTFSGYDIILAPFYDAAGGLGNGHEKVGNYTFWYEASFTLLAYKDGIAARLKDAYADGLLSDEQIGLIYQCFLRYNEEVYTG